MNRIADESAGHSYIMTRMSRGLVLGIKDVNLLVGGTVERVLGTLLLQRWRLSRRNSYL